MEQREVEEIRDQIIGGQKISRHQALRLPEADLEDLCQGADKIRQARCGKGFDLCSIISGKGGRCSENCKFCSQSSCSRAQVKSFAFRDPEQILADALHHYQKGIRRYCMVTSGRALTD
ncbi:MAG: biotin synthase BioB, partial [Eubacterium sp.]|nr:biotin synthase BioB [Eubacterium sp.]